MKTEHARNSGLALVGLAALLVYILACTSFSPDDKKVLYPSIDPRSGTVCAAVYDRETGRTRTVFTPFLYSSTNLDEKPLIRAQWLDAKRILVSWTSSSEDANAANLTLAVVPIAGNGGIKIFSFPSVEQARALLSMPIPVAGQYAFVPASNQVMRIDLANGRVLSKDTGKSQNDFYVYPDPAGEKAFYLQEEEGGRTFGRLDPASLATTALMTFTNDVGDGSFFTYDEQGKRIAFVEHSDKGQELVVLESGRPPFRRQIAGADDSLKFGPAVLDSRLNLLLAGYMRPATNGSSFGLMEIPLSDRPIRDTILIPHSDVRDDMAAMYFQAGISHDGKTAAVSSLYVACEGQETKASDCALFLVDLSHPQREVTKVPIPVPSQRQPGAK